MLPFLAGLWSSLRLMKAICGSYFVGLALTAWQSSSLKQSTAIHVPPIMKARSQVLRSQQSAMHMCMFFSSPRSLKFPAFIPPLRVTFFKIGLWVQWSSSWVDGSSTETEMWARNQNEKVVSLSCHFLPTPRPPLVLRHKLVDIEAIWFERNAILQKETLKKPLKFSFL